MGDSDLGLTMTDGFRAAYDAVKDSAETDIGKLFYFAGKAMGSAVPSTMGTLMASGLMNAGKELKGVEHMDGQWPKFFQSYFDGVQSRGKAQLGDKTFLDGLYPRDCRFAKACGRYQNRRPPRRDSHKRRFSRYERDACQARPHGHPRRTVTAVS